MTKPNLGKQRTVAGAYSHDAGTNTGKDLADCNFGNFTGTRDKIRAGADHPDLGTYPGATPNYYVSGDGFKMGKRLTHPDIDPDGSRALQKDWHRKAGFSGVVSATENEQGGTHPSEGTTRFKSRGTDTPTPGQGGPKGGGFSWR